MRYFRVIYSGITETKIENKPANYVVFTESIKEVLIPMEGIYNFGEANYEASVEAIISLIQDDGFVRINQTEWIPFHKIISIQSYLIRDNSGPDSSMNKGFKRKIKQPSHSHYVKVETSSGEMNESHTSSEKNKDGDKDQDFNSSLGAHS